MTRTAEVLSVEERVVVVFDMCSSSQIVENLTVRDNLRVLRNSLIRLKKFLQNKSIAEGFEVYKFIGDGWILLYPAGTRLVPLLNSLAQLSEFYQNEYRKRLLPALEIRPDQAGLKFGVDRGRLVRIVMMHKPEYVGRALNIAARLQAALSQIDPLPAYKVLIPRPAYNQMGKSKYHKAEEIKVPLKNIQGQTPFRCIKLALTV